MLEFEQSIIGREGRSVATQLSRATLEQLLTGSLACIRHKRWYDISVAGQVITKIHELGRGSLPDSTGVRNIGPPVGDALASESAAKSYFAASALFWSRLRTELFASLRNPVDALLENFNDIWPAGAAPGSHGVDSFSPGVFRWFQPGSSLNPHVDNSFEPLVAPFCSAARLAANVYMETTPETHGGLLELWDLTLSREQYELVRAPDFSLRREAIGPPALSLAAEPGDLIIFDAARIHAVSRLRRGTRLTASSFIGFKRTDGAATFFA
jgi:hypothetical protein